MDWWMGKYIDTRRYEYIDGETVYLPSDNTNFADEREISDNLRK